MNEKRASDLNVGELFREYGWDRIRRVIKIDHRGDSVLIDSESDEITLDRDTVVEIIDRVITGITGKITMSDGTVSDFTIDVDGWQQWGAVRERLGDSVHAVEVMHRALIEDDAIHEVS